MGGKTMLLVLLLPTRQILWRKMVIWAAPNNPTTKNKSTLGRK